MLRLMMNVEKLMGGNSCRAVPGLRSRLRARSGSRLRRGFFPRLPRLLRGRFLTRLALFGEAAFVVYLEPFLVAGFLTHALSFAAALRVTSLLIHPNGVVKERVTPIASKARKCTSLAPARCH